MARRGLEAFEAFYASAYGDRWPRLLEALRAPAPRTARPNAFPNMEPTYEMDPASILVAQSLGAQSGDKILDMCAAPGGKTLVVAEALFASGGEGLLVSNELSQDRRARLIRVLHQYVPQEIRSKIFVRGWDGNQFGLREAGEYDRVLLDAPCSGEKHLLENAKEMSEWSPRRSENLAVRQYSLLASAWSAVRPGGRVVYATCALSPLENDGVIAKLLKRKVDVTIERIEDSRVEPTEHGARILPDRGFGGPMYFSILSKGE